MRNRRRHSGFTLLEIMVVVAIISTLMTLAVLSIGDAGREGKLFDAAKRLQLVAALGSQEAVLSGRPVGVAIAGNGYEFKTYSQGDWQAHEGGRMFRPFEFNDGIEVIYEQLPTIEQNETPAMVFLPDGENLLKELAVVDRYTDYQLDLVPAGGGYDLLEQVE